MLGNTVYALRDDSKHSGDSVVLAAALAEECLDLLLQGFQTLDILRIRVAEGGLKVFGYAVVG